MKSKTGYTLVEAMISAAILAVMLISVYGVMITGNTIFTNDVTLLDMQQQTRNAIDRIVREVRQSSSHTITANYNSTTNDKIVFTIPTAIGIEYYLSGTNLIRSYPPGVTKIIASNISYLKFTQVGSLLTISTRASKSIYNKTISFPLTEKVRLRNE